MEDLPTLAEVFNSPGQDDLEEGEIAEEYIEEELASGFILEWTPFTA